MRREGIGSPLYSDKLLLASEAAKYLLPKEVTDNLTKGTPITTNTDQFGELKPYFYGDDFVSAVAGYVLGEQTLYSSEQFRYNALQFIKTFGLPEDLYVPVPSHEVSMYRRQVLSPNFYTVDTIPEHGRKARIFWQGRFNGFPHPGVLETLIILKNMLPNREIWCGVDTDTSSFEKGQELFMDPFFRASALKATGLIDYFLLISPPHNGNTDEVDEFWGNLYAVDAGGLSPDYVVALNDELIDSQKMQASRHHMSILYPEELHQVGNIHQTTLKNGTYPMTYLRNDWNIIREELADLTSIGD